MDKPLTEREIRIKNILLGGDEDGHFPCTAEELAKATGEPESVITEFLESQGLNK